MPLRPRLLLRLWGISGVQPQAPQGQPVDTLSSNQSLSRQVGTQCFCKVDLA